MFLDIDGVQNTNLRYGKMDEDTPRDKWGYAKKQKCAFWFRLQNRDAIVNPLGL